MASTASQRRWATPQEWDSYRGTITRLYWDQGRPLKDVGEIMRREYGFNATEKMYKTRVKKWGLTKYVKVGKANEPRGEVEIGDISVPVIRSRVTAKRRSEGDWSHKQFQSLTEFEPSLRSIVLLRGSQGLNPSPLATQVESPWQFKCVESCLTAVLDYSQSRFQTKQWDPTIDLFRTDHSATWGNQVSMGHAMIKNGKMKEGFRMIDICLKNYKSVIQREHPLILIETYTTLMYLSVHRLDLAESILRYLAGLCRAYLGPAHPFSRLWTNLISLGMERLRQAAAVIIKSQLTLLATYFKPDAEFLLNQRVDTARQAHCFGGLSIEEAEEDIANAIDLKQKKGMPDTLTYVCWAKEMLAFVYKHNKRYSEAASILDEVGKHIGSGEVDDFEINEYYSIKCQIATEIGTSQEYTALLREKLDWAASAVGTSHHWTMTAVTLLDAEYGKHNDAAASAKLHEEFNFESNWDIICEKVDSKIQTIEEQS
ncbi:Clr5 domain-containing protein [Truncatella angustata]|uniref:Clr5 domain-containing protein n=1 Tax=Truncatella angustata TaxID=152316 RepID=A0A9P9A5K3_9PEZI|nr:Clr5 domain-containing protein [Truncatella angustata]KAH6660934.1 Clr5 domain-containing protein [Truncatella angustata]KAH8196745.1 hypothetical protein TruAng_009100 [Truncatella angustata]